jgi:hypothetical protein
MAIVLMAVLHWPTFAGTFGLRSGRADWSIRRKREPVPKGYVTGLLATIPVVELLPYLEELWRDLRAKPPARGVPPRPHGRRPPPRPAAA